MPGRAIGSIYRGILLTCFSVLPLSASVGATLPADVCSNGIVTMSDASQWSGERDAMCADHVRVQAVQLDRERHGDWDSLGMGIKCCNVGGEAAPTGDYCETVVVSGSGEGTWTGNRYAGCTARLGGYVAGFYLNIQGDQRNDSCVGGKDHNFETKFLSLKCCYPANPLPETCSGNAQFAEDVGHWTGLRTGDCGAGQYIRSVEFSQTCYDSGDKEETGMGLTCCKALPPTPTPTPTPSPIPITPTPAPGVMNFSPNGFDLGDVIVGTGMTQSVNITNNTGYYCQSCALSLSNATAFSIGDLNMCSTIPDQASCTVPLVAKPPGVTNYSTNIKIACGTCTPPIAVKFGANGNFITKSFAIGSTAACTYIGFNGDPAPGYAKTCIRLDTGAQIAAEGDNFTIPAP